MNRVSRRASAVILLIAVLVGEILIAWREGDAAPKIKKSTPRAKGDAYANKN